MLLNSAVDLLQNEEVEAIIGPGSSMQANFMIGLGSKARVPIISFLQQVPLFLRFRANILSELP